MVLGKYHAAVSLYSQMETASATFNFGPNFKYRVPDGFNGFYKVKDIRVPFVHTPTPSIDSPMLDVIVEDDNDQQVLIEQQFDEGNEADDLINLGVV